MQLRHCLRHCGAALLATLALSALPASATTILFIGNSFTYGDPAGGSAAVYNYRPDSVTDLNGTGMAGVPALFKAMTERAGLDYDVSLETVGGSGLDYHYNNKLGAIAKPWDKVLLQSYSTLDASNPGNPDTLIRYAGLLAEVFHDQNPDVDVRLTATWSRADQTWLPSGAWYGQTISQMALDVRAGYDAADRASDLINGVIPVGEAWNRAFAAGLADSNPYDGIGAGQIDLWAPDAYHGSAYGYYLEALTIFGSVTGLDPRLLGRDDDIARELGISGDIAWALQGFAAEQLAAEAVPEPGMLLTFATLGGILVALRRRPSRLRARV